MFRRLSQVFLLSVSFTVILMGCNKDIPEPETNSRLSPVNGLYIVEPIPVTTVMAEGPRDFFVKHIVQGNDVLIECIVDGVSFRSSSETKAKFVVYVDGKKTEEVSAAAFKVRNLPAGIHHIKLEVVKDDHSSYFLTKEFAVQIQ